MEKNRLFQNHRIFKSKLKKSHDFPFSEEQPLFGCECFRNGLSGWTGTFYHHSLFKKRVWAKAYGIIIYWSFSPTAYLHKISLESQDIGNFASGWFGYRKWSSKYQMILDSLGWVCWIRKNEMELNLRCALFNSTSTSNRVFRNSDSPINRNLSSQYFAWFHNIRLGITH